ncbi:MAG TPA: CYTH domain-containing protein, partial [Clostridiales bacterium]|nr:CYTH domain-containing protein [Clostridiales bacterium]
MEREYKLACPQEGFFSAELWSFLGATPTEIKLHALYFDTEDALLFTNGVCFRLRREGGQIVAAVKAKPKEDQGEASGFFSRYEWETRAKTWEEGLDRLLEAIEIPEVRKTLETAREKGIIIQTETNFTRQFAHIKRGST